MMHMEVGMFRKPRASAMARRALLCVALAAAAAGCSHSRSYLALDAAARTAVRADLGVAGVLDRRAEQPAVAAEATALLVKTAEAKDLSASFGAGALALLMAPPSELRIQAEMLKKIRALVGRRYVLVGQLGSAATDRGFYWSPYVVLPFPFVSIGTRKSVAPAEDYDVPHAVQVLRLIDLEDAALRAEFHLVLCEAPEKDAAWRGDLRDALRAMALE
jgi:hypothetical protein